MAGAIPPYTFQVTTWDDATAAALCLRWDQTDDLQANRLGSLLLTLLEVPERVLNPATPDTLPSFETGHP
eukprot:10783839-Prorocentrum_lima.AAC.1